jgi:hypothetical protein
LAILGDLKKHEIAIPSITHGRIYRPVRYTFAVGE